MAEILHVQSLEHPLMEFETGARVWKPSASRFDFAYLRVGRVIREDGRIGVLYAGANAVIQYPEETVFAYVTLE